MGRIWDYFKKDLSFPLIQQSGILAGLVQGGAEVLEQIWQEIIWLRRQFTPATCEHDYLDDFAKSRGITRNRVENDEVYRRRVILAYAWQMLGGYIKGLPRIYEACGYVDVDIVELTDDQWAEFDLELRALVHATDEDWEYLIWLANEYKRASSRLRTVRMIVKGEGHIRLACAPQTVNTVSVWPVVQGDLVTEQTLRLALAPQTIPTITVYPPALKPPEAPVHLRAVLAQQAITMITVYPTPPDQAYSNTLTAQLFTAAILLPPTVSNTILPLEN